MYHGARTATGSARSCIRVARPDKTYDVACIGAGPAGAWTAFALASRGARVLLLDPSHPREKPCGGGVTGRALDLVASALDTRALPAVPIESARFTASSTTAVASVTLPDGALAVVGRTEFDGLLVDAAQRAGASLRPCRVTTVSRTPGGFAIETREETFQSAFVVGADGANSLVRRRLGRPFRIDQLSIATGFFAHGLTRREIALDLLSEPQGYLWSFPRPTHLAIGVCAQADSGSRAADLRQIVARWIDRSDIGMPTRLEPYSWPIPSLSAPDFERLEPSVGCCFFVGDAAGLVDPLTREGIYFALLSAQWAADAIMSGNEGGSRAYTRRIRDCIGTELARAARLKSSFFHPRFTSLLIDGLKTSPSIARVMADLVAGAQSYKGLAWRLARTCEVGLAARLLKTRRGTSVPSLP
jgi:geranylgeranyl reductase family protein